MSIIQLNIHTLHGCGQQGEHNMFISERVAQMSPVID